MLGIINYGLGNINSLVNMVKKVGGSAIIVNNKEDLLKVDRLILPGVGAFDYGIKLLRSLDYYNYLENTILSGDKLLLGVCLGAQLLTISSEEGNENGLGWVNGVTEKFKFDTNKRLRIPHVGWNDLKIISNNKLLVGLETEARFYFTHSYFIKMSKSTDILATTNYGCNFVSIYNNKNIYGVQFHPEKSHKYGMKLIQNFIKL
ncbi:MAG: imidazole glycerol phosphate synthase subunit HisH [Microgenomates group bacterium]